MCNLCPGAALFLPPSAPSSAAASSSSHQSQSPVLVPFIPPFVAEDASRSSCPGGAEPLELSTLLDLIMSEPHPSELGFAALSAGSDSESELPGDAPSHPHFVKEGTALGVDITSLPHLSRTYVSLWKSYRRNAPSPPSPFTLRVTLGLLLLTPDNGSAWNDRKAFLAAATDKPQPSQEDLATALQLLYSELYLLDLLFTKSPKAPTSWFHRLWVVRRLFSLLPSSSRPLPSLPSPPSVPSSPPPLLLRSLLSSLPAVLKRELQCASKTLHDKSPRNYHAWTYRLQLLGLHAAELERREAEEEEEEKREEEQSRLERSKAVLLETEQAFCHNHISKNPFDYSCASYLLVVLSRFSEPAARLRESLAVVERLLPRDSGTEGGGGEEERGVTFETETLRKTRTMLIKMLESARDATARGGSKDGDER